MSPRYFNRAGQDQWHLALAAIASVSMNTAAS
jgi:hypothetical protein